MIKVRLPQPGQKWTQQYQREVNTRIEQGFDRMFESIAGLNTMLRIPGASIFLDPADADLKVIFTDGTVKIIATDP